ncbi:MAG: ABC transporter substrate-binding protein [Bacteroidia bacterium]|nr:ABC transporter substrate-binding protein [Bacteroidia bacterium]
MASPSVVPALLPLWTLAVSLALLSSCAPARKLERPRHPLPAGVDVMTQPPGKPGGLFVTTNSGEPQSFNPLVIEDADSGEIADLFLDSLFKIDPVTQDIVPGLALSWKFSPDKKQLEVNLREGLKWSDGEPLTADDVLFTFRCIFDPRSPNRYASQFTIAGKPLMFEKTGPLQVRFTTPGLYSPLLNDLASVAILPEHALGKAAAEGNLQKTWTIETGIKSPEKLIASGPFRVFSYQPGDRLLLEPNPHYWRADRNGQRLPYIDLYVVKFVKDQNAELVHFATGQTDFSPIPAPDTEWVRRGEALHGYRIYDRGPSTSISFIWFNLHPGKDPKGKPHVEPYKLRWFQDRRFRQAVSFGFNRQGLIDGVFFGRASKLHSIISEGNIKWHHPGVPHFDYDPDRARALLAEAGFRTRPGGLLEDAEGHPVDFEILAPQGGLTTPQILTSFTQDMRALGIQVKLSYIDFGTLIARTGQTFDYEAGIMGFTGGGDPSGGKALYLSSGRLHLWHPQQNSPATEWEARVDAIIEEQEKTFDPLARKRLIDEMQTLIAMERPLIFLVTPNAFVGLKTRWKNTLQDTRGRLVVKIDEIWEDSPP